MPANTTTLTPEQREAILAISGQALAEAGIPVLAIAPELLELN